VAKKYSAGIALWTERQAHNDNVPENDERELIGFALS